MQNHFDYGKLEVYQVELAFLIWLAPLLTKMKTAGVGARSGEVIDQLDRASLSALLNTAEGNGRRQRQTRAKFLADARRVWTRWSQSASARLKRSTKEKKLLLRVVSMLSKLIDHFDQRLNEEESSYGSRIEDEDEDE